MDSNDIIERNKEIMTNGYLLFVIGLKMASKSAYKQS